jgi:hypothetical protein
MAKAKVNINQLNSVLNSIDKAYITRLDKIEKQFKKSIDKMANDAKRDAPIGVLNSYPDGPPGKHPGRLADSIYWDEVGKLSYQLRADAPYAAYVEFGTGPNFKNYPGKDAYWQNIAKDFKINGKGWTISQPFFYPNVNKELPKLITRIGKILSQNA